MGVMLAWCKGTAGEDGSEHMHSGGSQLWGSRLASCSLTVVESWAGCQQRF